MAVGERTTARPATLRPVHRGHRGRAGNRRLPQTLLPYLQVDLRLALALLAVHALVAPARAATGSDTFTVSAVVVAGCGVSSNLLSNAKARGLPAVLTCSAVPGTSTIPVPRAAVHYSRDAATGLDVLTIEF